MPGIVEYARVLEAMRSKRWRCVYYNSGAFAPEANDAPAYVGWIGPDDPTIRPDMLDFAVSVARPHAPVLAELTTRAWQTLLPGELWLMPASHWAFELDHSPHKSWLGNLLDRLNLDRQDLARRTDASAIAFAMDESGAFERACGELLERMHSSDFALAFPDHPVGALLHHHRQVWWTLGDTGLQGRLRQLPAMVPGHIARPPSG
jgi:hypothetical protein